MIWSLSRDLTTIPYLVVIGIVAVEEGDSRWSCFNPSLLFISKGHNTVLTLTPPSVDTSLDIDYSYFYMKNLNLLWFLKDLNPHKYGMRVGGGQVCSHCAISTWCNTTDYFTENVDSARNKIVHIQRSKKNYFGFFTRNCEGFVNTKKQFF